MNTYGSIDLGGTHLKIALIREDASILDKLIVPIKHVKNNGNSLATYIKEILDQFISNNKQLTITAFSFAVPCVVKNNTFLLASNIPQDFSSDTMQDYFSEKLPNSKLYFINDVRAAAWGEIWQGNLRDINTGLYINIGTGLSLALVINGEIHSGWEQSAGEIAYCIPTTTEPQYITQGIPYLENVFSGCALEMSIRDYMKKEIDNPIYQTLATNTDTFWDETINHINKDEKIMEIIVNRVHVFSTLLFNMIYIINPQVIVLGGGVSQGLSTILLPILQEYINKTIFSPLLCNCKEIHEIGLLGGAYYCIKNTKENKDD